MNKEQAYDVWNTHLDKWITFLSSSINRLQEQDEDANRGDIVKLQRQLAGLYNVRYGAVVSSALINAFIYPEGVTNDKEIEEFPLYNGSLNASQKAAVWKALAADNICLIQGPPGTGKTTVITEICTQILLSDPRARILICSETHVAVNNVLEKLYESLDDFGALRINNKESNSGADVDNSSVESLLEDYYHNLKEAGVSPEVISGLEDIFGHNLVLTAKDLIQSRRVVGITCNGIGAFSLLGDDVPFDYVIIDEVSKATLPEILMPMSVGRKAILVGDPAQLPPLFCYEDRDIMEETDTEEVERYKYIDQLFERVPESNCSMLDKQFRMTNEIGDLISHFFYNGKLKNGVDRSIPGSALWVDYFSEQKWPQEFGDPIYNLDEVQIILALLDEQNQRNKAKAPKSVAVISPYRRQIKILRDEIGSRDYGNLDITVDTVDAFQGKDAEYVIFSVTRNTGSMRFFSDPRRVNVALSRAKERLWVVGSSEYTKRNTLLNELYDRMTKIHWDGGSLLANAESC